MRMPRSTEARIALALLAVGCVFALLSGIQAMRAGFAVSRFLSGGGSPTADRRPPTAHSDGPRRLLDGLPVASATTTRPFAVMIEQHVDARPASGVSRAALVFEAPVEGGITRLLAVFDGADLVEEIGPVRSARPYYLDWVAELDAAYAHVGGSPAALARIDAGAVRDLNEFFWGRFFWRSPRRSAPHNVYTSSGLLAQARAVRGWDAEPKAEVWRFADAPADAAFLASFEMTIPFSSPSYAVTWRWDPATRRFVRSLGGELARDRDGTAQRAANVAILFTETEVLDADGRLALRTTGGGRAILVRDGAAVPGRWEKPSASARLRFYDGSGAEAVWRPGPTWIEVVPTEVADAISVGG